MNTRLKQFLSAENITQAQLADNLNVVRASVSHILSGRNNPGYDFIKALMEKYPKLNIEWLIFGKGKMYKDSPTESLLQFDEVHEIPSVKHETEPKEEIEQPNLFNSIDNTPQRIVTQRKITKIIVFFDDDTYQEL